MSMERFVRRNDLAKRLGVHGDTIERWAKAGKDGLRWVKLGKLVYIDTANFKPGGINSDCPESKFSPEPQNEYFPTPITAFRIKQPGQDVYVHEGRLNGVSIRQDDQEMFVTRDSAVRLASALTQIVASLDARKEISS